MKSISIKSFIVTIMCFIIIIEAIIFYISYQDTKRNINELLTQNLQNEILNLEHYMKKSLQEESFNKVVAHLDSFIALNPAVDDIHVFNNEQILIYDPDAKGQNPSHYQEKQCLNVSQIRYSDLFKENCYTFSTRTYTTGLTPKYYYSYIYINSAYTKSLLNKELIKIVIFFSVATLIFSILLWLLIKKYLIVPLESLKQYAYYSENPPKKFFIQELESIRYSLKITFQRLKHEQKELYNLSTKDSLSGLYNRISLTEKLNWLISKGKRDKGEFALIFLDLDNFKNINDSKGHEFGDKILLHISNILLKITRNDDIVSRLGGDEFVIVLPEFKDENKITEMAQRLKEKLSAPFKIDNEDYQITASMGIAIYPKDGNNVQMLLKNADIAMYKSKELGKNNFQFFTTAINKAVQERIKIQRIIKNALINDYFKLYYQPKVDIRTNKIVGCEALIRLIDPIEGLITPDKFISIAEDNMSIIPLGEWIIQEAVSQIQKWEQTVLKNLKVSINLSGIQFKDPKLLQKIENYTQGIDRKKLDIELTESVLIDDFQERLNVIKSIKKLGISLSLDDFGTGYSSLSYLKDIPFDTLKIDKTFIDNLYTKDDLTFVNMIIGIAEDLELNVVAEGVETEEQLRLLKEINCDLYQGYLYSKPILAKEFEELFILN